MLAVVENAAEYFSSVYFARQGRIGLVASITAGSAIQVTLLVAPVLMPPVAPARAAHEPRLRQPARARRDCECRLRRERVTRDGEATWLEGVMRVAVYTLLAFAFFFAMPPPA